jgi:hypothetical protein
LSLRAIAASPEKMPFLKTHRIVATGFIKRTSRPSKSLEKLPKYQLWIEDHK